MRPFAGQSSTENSFSCFVCLSRIEKNKITIVETLWQGEVAPDDQGEVSARLSGMNSFEVGSNRRRTKGSQTSKQM